VTDKVLRSEAALLFTFLNAKQTSVEIFKTYSENIVKTFLILLIMIYIYIYIQSKLLIEELNI
jgi:hypothetical protein